MNPRIKPAAHPAGKRRNKFDPTRLEIFKNLYHSVAEEMGASLRRSAFSPNIKERRDYSCAVFDGAGNVLAMGDHMPVHLGSMPMSVAAAIADQRLNPGDIVVLNDPYAGGTHLPDLTMVMPVYIGASYKPGITKPAFYVANRAHHADIGGSQAGSMGLAREIFQEGLRISPVKLMAGGKIVRDVLQMILYNVRTPNEREGDLTAQIASCRIGERRLSEIVAKYGLAEVNEYARHLLEYSAEMMRATLRTIPPAHIAAKIFSITTASPRIQSASPPQSRFKVRKPRWISRAAIPSAPAASTPLLRSLILLSSTFSVVSWTIKFPPPPV